MPANAEQYYYNPGNMPADAGTEAADGGRESLRAFTALLKTSEAAGNYQTATCQIIRGESSPGTRTTSATCNQASATGVLSWRTDTNCQLKTETIDGVTTVNSFMATGL